MNNQSNSQLQPAKKLAVKKESIQVLTQAQSGASNEPTQYCTLPC